MNTKVEAIVDDDNITLELNVKQTFSWSDIKWVIDRMASILVEGGIIHLVTSLSPKSRNLKSSIRSVMNSTHPTSRSAKMTRHTLTMSGAMLIRKFSALSTTIFGIGPMTTGLI